MRPKKTSSFFTVRWVQKFCCLWSSTRHVDYDKTITISDFRVLSSNTIDAKNIQHRREDSDSYFYIKY